jgi:death-on-curing protein
VIAFLGLNGQRLVVTNDQAYELLMAGAAEQLDDLNVIADHLRRGSRPRP